MADNIPYKYRKSDSELTENEVIDAVKFFTTKGNLKEPKSQPKTKVLNPFFLMMTCHDVFVASFLFLKYAIFSLFLKTESDVWAM